MSESTSNFADNLSDLAEQLGSAQQRHHVSRRGEREPIPEHVRFGVKMRDGFKCVWCLSNRDLQLDHIVPWSAGGSDRSDNLRTLCAGCNESRSNRRYAGDIGPATPVARLCTRCDTPDEPEWTGLTQAFCLYCRRVGRSPHRDLL